MAPRRVWVKRSACSATLVSYLEDAIVDELRDQVIRKYANSLRRKFDSPDIVTKITPRQGLNRQAQQERLLNLDEILSSVLDAYYPRGQTIEEALVINVPTGYTPRPSPRYTFYGRRRSECSKHGDYSPLMLESKDAPVLPPPPRPPSSLAGVDPPSGLIPTTDVAPGPFAAVTWKPWVTAYFRFANDALSCTYHARYADFSAFIFILWQKKRLTSIEPGNFSHDQTSPAALAPTALIPPAPTTESLQAKTHTALAPAASPRSLRTRKNCSSPGAALGGLVDGTVPPINVLIVEDNIINQKLLNACTKRLNVRWVFVVDGEEAVRKWRQGGFHLMLMDIHLPIMNGLDATKEVRRLERLNGIGVFSKTDSGRSTVSKSPSGKGPGPQRSPSEEDTLANLSVFCSPVVIVAFTASILQSDRHDALAAGCNDFLTKASFNNSKSLYFNQY
ncbi:hypothetical protein N7517_008091 [Penicillium concentricum]|uniref:Response regulatory domain-containing protein n=1 Tax=Penicillium concentricum TaxID=293559 RepID=A0A9W9RT74_9EURO|nr:uncharacterized protein N7517_008091 [Penicillium concentricum]KAJ5365205.1 hypothetical protein N7517_008091 [Penicillium concentricum]